MMQLSYKATLRTGAGVVGVTDAFTPAGLAELLFKRRYRTLIIYRGDQIVGAIERHPDTGRRRWWAEGSSKEEER